MTIKRHLQILYNILYPIGFGLIIYQNWKIALGVLIVGWAMNTENEAKTL